MLTNKLTINVVKTNALVVFPTTKIPPCNISHKCNEVSITIQDHVKYLGPTLDNKLNFKKHLNGIKRKVACAVGIMNRLKFIFPKETLLQLYHALIYPHILYALPVWGSIYKTYKSCCTAK